MTSVVPIGRALGRGTLLDESQTRVAAASGIDQAIGGSGAPDSFIAFEHIAMTFGSHRVIDDLNLRIGRGEFLSLLGPSGSGKTTILMLLAGFLRPTAGSITLNAARIDHLPPHRRDMGVVFQSYALFPHMSVADNVAFPLKMRHAGRADVEERVKRALDMVQLSHLGDRRPARLSGGQQQRVALARALVFEPAVVLMDEPLGALDKQLRERMQLDIRDLHRRLGLTIVFVTHDQTEALTMSDRIAVFNNGRIDQIGTPDSIYDRPASRFVAEFIGETNVMSGIIVNADARGTLIRLDSGEQLVAAPTGEPGSSGEAMVSVRPERVMVQPAGAAREAGASGNVLPARVADSVYQGNHLRLHLDCGSRTMIAHLDRRAIGLEIGAKVDITFRPTDCWVIAK